MKAIAGHDWQETDPQFEYHADYKRRNLSERKLQSISADRIHAGRPQFRSIRNKQTYGRLASGETHPTLRRDVDFKRPR